MTILKFSLTAIILASLSWQVAAFDPDKALEGHDLKKIGLEGQELRDAGVVKKGNLFWMRCSLGQAWSGATCTGKATKHVWDDAKVLPGLMNSQGGFAGVSDWRLPTILELYTLVDCGRSEKQELTIPVTIYTSKCKSYILDRAAISQSDFPNTPKAYTWSITSPLTEHFAYWVNFKNGEAFVGGRQAPRFVRLVRDKCVSCKD